MSDPGVNLTVQAAAIAGLPRTEGGEGGPFPPQTRLRPGHPRYRQAAPRCTPRCLTVPLSQDFPTMWPWP